MNDRLPVLRQRGCRQSFPNALDCELPCFQIGIRHENEELLPAVAKNVVIRPEVPAKVLHGGLENLIPDEMSVGVVDALEVINVHEGHAG